MSSTQAEPQSEKSEHKIVHQRKIIDIFQNKQSNQSMTQSMDDQLKELFKNKLREIQIKDQKLKKEQTKDSRHKKSYNQNKDYNKKQPKNKNYNKGKDYQKKNYGVVERHQLTEEEKVRVDKIGEEAGKWLEQNKANVSDNKKIIKETKLKLLVMTFENYSEIQKDMVQMLQQIENDESLLLQFMQAILDRAWSQPTYTSLYANLCQELARESKIYKVAVVKTVSNEFYISFNEFYDLIIKLETPGVVFDYEEQKFEKYMKRKNKLIGNISMIAELYKNGFLPHNIIRYICCNLINEMTIYHYKMKEFEKEHDKKFEFSFTEEFVEVLIKLFDLAGIEMIRKEEKQIVALMSRIERDKEQIPDIEEKLFEDNKYKQQKIQLMLNHIEKKLGKQNKYFSDQSSFPIKQEDYPKFNCINVSIEFLRNCDRFGLSERMVSLAQNLFDKLSSKIALNRMQIKSCTVQLYMSLETEPTPKKATEEPVNYMQKPKQENYMQKNATGRTKRFGSTASSNQENRTTRFGSTVSQNQNEETLTPLTSSAQKRFNSKKSRDQENCTKPFKAESNSQKSLDKKKEDLTELKAKITRFMKDNQKTSEEDIYQKYFIDNKPEFSAYDIKSLVKVFLDCSIECYFTTALVRAKLVSFLMKEYCEDIEKIVLSDFAVIFVDFLYKIFSEGMSDDYPHLTKSIPMMMFDQISTFKSDLITLNLIKWHDEEFMVFEQKYQYKTVFEEAIKLMNENRQNFSDEKFDSINKSLQEIVACCK